MSETVRDRGLIAKDHQQEMAYEDRMVTWPMTSRNPESQVVTPIRLEPNMSKTAAEDAMWQYGRLS